MAFGFGINKTVTKPKQNNTGYGFGINKKEPEIKKEPMKPLSYYAPEKKASMSDILGKVKWQPVWSQAFGKKTPDDAMRFPIGEGLSNVTTVAPGPRISTQEAINRGDVVKPVEVGKQPQISQTAKAQQLLEQHIEWRTQSDFEKLARIEDKVGKVITGTVVAGLVFNPLTTALGLAAFISLSELENALVSTLKDEKYQLGAGRELMEFADIDSANEKAFYDIAEFVGKGIIVGGVLKAPKVADMFIKGLAEKYSLPIQTQALIYERTGLLPPDKLIPPKKLRVSTQDNKPIKFGISKQEEAKVISNQIERQGLTQPNKIEQKLGIKQTQPKVEPKTAVGEPLKTKIKPQEAITEPLAPKTAKVSPKTEPLITEAKKAPVKVDTEVQSRVFERIKAENTALEGDLGYDPIKLKADATKAVDLVAKDKQKAYDIAMGKEKSTDITSTAVNIALAEKALVEGDTALFAKLTKSRSLEQTRRGQELVAEKGSITDNSTSRYVKELVSSRLDNLGKDYLGDLKDPFKKKSPKQKAIAKIDRETNNLELRIKSKKLTTQEALSLLDKLTCLT